MSWIVGDNNQIGEHFLVLGAGKYLKNGQINRYYRYRLEALFTAYEEGAVSLAILSGGPDEVQSMVADLTSMGVDPAILRCDPLGVRTYESFKNYRNMWGGDSVVVVTQRFHMARSLRLARHLNVQATPWYAKSVGGVSGVKVAMREILARGKMIYDLIKPTPLSLVPSRISTKKQLRRYVKERLSHIGNSYQSRSSHTIVRRIIASQEFQSAQQILLFYPMQNEVDLRPLIEECWRLRKKIALPRICGDDMEFLLVSQFSDLELHPFGCMEPIAKLPVASPSEDSLLMVPGLAYDPTTGMRLGRGKGYYDRFLTNSVKEYAKCTVAMALFQCQVLQGVPHDTWDIPIPSAVTEVDFYGEWE